jgi:hydrogenase small subunit
MRGIEFGTGHALAESQLVHVIWLTSGLGCDGESVALTGATSPSLEDLWRGVLPGMPRLAIANPMLAYESGEEFLRPFRDAAAGRLDPFILVLEGAVANEALSGEGSWAAFGVRRLARPARPARGGGDRDGDVRRVRRRAGDARQPDRGDGAR